MFFRVRLLRLIQLIGVFYIVVISAALHADPLYADPLYKEVKIPSEFGYTNDALFFPKPNAGAEIGALESAVILVHQSSAHKESWIDFAHQLQGKGIASLSIEDVGRRSVLDAVRYLKDKGYHKIMFVGASIGGGAVLQASSQISDPANNQFGVTIEKVVLLSTSSATAIASSKIDKLFIVAKADMWGSDSYTLFEESAEPKKLIEYKGFTHGQDFLKGEHGTEVSDLIIRFLLGP